MLQKYQQLKFKFPIHIFVSLIKRPWRLEWCAASQLGPQTYRGWDLATWRGQNWARPHVNHSADNRPTILTSVGCLMFQETTPVPSQVRVSLVRAQGATLAAAGWRQCLVPVPVVSILIEVSTHETQPPPSQQPQWGTVSPGSETSSTTHRHHRPVVPPSTGAGAPPMCKWSRVSSPAPACSTYTCCLLWRATSHCFPPPQTWFLLSASLLVFMFYLIFLIYRRQSPEHNQECNGTNFRKPADTCLEMWIKINFDGMAACKAEVPPTSSTTLGG